MRVFHSFNSRSDGLRCDFSTNNFRYQWAIWISPTLTLKRMDFNLIFQQINLMQLLPLALPESFEMLLPDSFECLSNPQQSLGNPLRALFLRNREFFCHGETFFPYTWGPLGCLLGFWPSGQKPCGSKLLTLKSFLRLRIGDVFYSKQVNLSKVSYWIPLIYGGCYSKGLIDSIFTRAQAIGRGHRS